MDTFRNKHSGTCLLIGNAPNLLLTPPELFDYPSFGMNTIHKSSYTPSYYVTVDSRVRREFGEVMDIYKDIPKFLPSPDLDSWKGENVYRFFHRPGELWQPDLPGFAYINVMHVAMQLACFMGFTKFLIIGMQHGKEHIAHFWGHDEGARHYRPPVDKWIEGYKILREGLGLDMVNLSPETCVPEDVIPRDDYKKYLKG